MANKLELSPEIPLITYYQVFDHARGKEQTLTVLKVRWRQSLRVILMDQLPFHQRNRPRSWLCFLLDDLSVVEREDLTAPYRRWIRVDGGAIESGSPPTLGAGTMCRSAGAQEGPRSSPLLGTLSSPIFVSPFRFRTDLAGPRHGHGFGNLFAGMPVVLLIRYPISLFNSRKA